MRIDRFKLNNELFRRGMTQTQLAKLSGVSRVTVSSIIGGKACQNDTGHKIARALGVDISDLLEEKTS